MPSEAQAVINSIVRSAPNSSAALLEAQQPLIDLGLSEQEAIRVGFGSFPVAGKANFVHDWYFPRYGSTGFRFHQGTDVFAAAGTPLRAVTDGTLRATNGGLGGLAVRVVQPDGTYFYYAHLAALVDGYKEGMKVKTGDIIGYVGDSGNARGGSPHLHLGIYLPGGKAIDPKPYLDKWLADAMQRLPKVIEQVRSGKTPTSSSVEIRRPRALLAAGLLEDMTARTAASDLDTDMLYQASSNPTTGGLAVAEAQARRLAESIDWTARAVGGAVGSDGRSLLDLTADALRDGDEGAERAGE